MARVYNPLFLNFISLNYVRDNLQRGANEMKHNTRNLLCREKSVTIVPLYQQITFLSSFKRSLLLLLQSLQYNKKLSSMLLLIVEMDRDKKAD